MKDIILVDIDGTLADCSHRVHHVQKEPKDWPTFYKNCEFDIGILPVIELIKQMQQRFRIYLCTGRSRTQGGHDIGELTKEWVDKWDIYYEDILFRPDGDYRPDFVVKKELVEKEGIKNSILFVLEDRASVVKMWREWGLACFQVAEGDF